MASCSARFASSTIYIHVADHKNRKTRRKKKVSTILLLPRTKIVTARVFAHSSITSILSRVVPNDTSRTMPAFPSFSLVRSSNRGTILPCVAIAMSWVKHSSDYAVLESPKRTSISGPPTHRTAGSSFCINRWLASSSKPH